MADSLKTVQFRPPVTGTTSTTPTVISPGDGGVVSEGGDSSLRVSDMTSRQLLEGILIELKKINLRQEAVFEEIVTDEDVSCE